MVQSLSTGPYLGYSRGSRSDCRRCIKTVFIVNLFGKLISPSFWIISWRNKNNTLLLLKVVLELPFQRGDLSWPRRTLKKGWLVQCLVILPQNISPATSTIKRSAQVANSDVGSYFTQFMTAEGRIAKTWNMILQFTRLWSNHQVPTSEEEGGLCWNCCNGQIPNLLGGNSANTSLISQLLIASVIVSILLLLLRGF